MTSTAISITADRPYVKAVNELADRKGVNTGDLVRKALDQVYGTEINLLLPFFANTGNKNSQLPVNIAESEPEISHE